MGFPSFNSGDIFYASDANAIGLWKVTDATATFTGGTAGSVSNGTVTSGSANTAVTVTAFSANFENYYVVVSGGAGSTDLALNLTLGASATGYYLGGKGRTFAGADINQDDANTASWLTVGYVTTNNINAAFTLYGPQTTKRTMLSGSYTSASTAAFSGNVHYGGMHDVATAYTDFTLTCSTGNITGGTIRVYGYRN